MRPKTRGEMPAEPLVRSNHQVIQTSTSSHYYECSSFVARLLRCTQVSHLLMFDNWHSKDPNERASSPKWRQNPRTRKTKSVRTFRSEFFLSGIEIDLQDVFREQSDLFYSRDLSCTSNNYPEEAMLTPKCA